MLYNHDALGRLETISAPRPGPYPDVFIINPTTSREDRLTILYDGLILPASRTPSMIRLARGIVHDAIASGSVRPDDVIGQLQSVLDWQGANLPYVEDPMDEHGYQMELFKQPWRALEDHGDDCEGKVTVTATLFNALGYPSVPIWLEQEEERQNHVAGQVGVPIRAAAAVRPAGEYRVTTIRPADAPKIRGSWLTFESTLSDVRLPTGQVVRGALIGEHPYDVLRRMRAGGVVRLGL